jgi:rhombotail lipoprotein
MRLFRYLLLIFLASAIGGCASTSLRSARQAGSLVDFLYPKATSAPAMTPTVTELRPPVRVGVAFVPGNNRNMALSEQEKLQLLERVKTSFSSQPFIGKIELIPSTYLRPGGGFDNLDQVARMFDVEVMALLSYDQVRFNDMNAAAVLYWTIVGAYVIQGDRYDVQTMVDAAVFDVKSRKLLFRAPGISQVKGSATWANFTEQARTAQTQGYAQAVDQLIPQLQAELGAFRERVKSDPQFRVANKAGYRGGGSAGWLAALGALGLLLIGHARRYA